MAHRLRVQDPWLKVIQQEQVVAVQKQPVLLHEQPVLVLLPTLSHPPLIPHPGLGSDGSVPGKCRHFMITVPRLPWFWVTAEECRANAVIASNLAMIYRIGILCQG